MSTEKRLTESQLKKFHDRKLKMFAAIVVLAVILSFLPDRFLLPHLFFQNRYGAYINAGLIFFIAWLVMRFFALKCPSCGMQLPNLNGSQCPHCSVSFS